jgi:hypothetical protein
MKILVYENRKCDPSYYDASTPEKELAAYLLLFKQLEDWDIYCELKEFVPADQNRMCKPCEKGLHKYCEEDDCFCNVNEKISVPCVNNLRRQRMVQAEFVAQKKLYDAAKQGDANSAKQLIRRRKDYEYEDVSLQDVIDPLQELEQ